MAVCVTGPLRVTLWKQQKPKQKQKKTQLFRDLAWVGVRCCVILAGGSGTRQLFIGGCNWLVDVVGRHGGAPSAVHRARRGRAPATCCSSHRQRRHPAEDRRRNIRRPAAGAVSRKCSSPWALSNDGNHRLQILQRHRLRRWRPPCRQRLTSRRSVALRPPTSSSRPRI